jgi:hypothetical protein
VSLVCIRYSTSPHIPLLLFRIYADEWFRFGLGARNDSPRNGEGNRTEINRDAPQQAKPTNLGVNVNNPNNSAGHRMPPNITSSEKGEKAAARELTLDPALNNNNPNQFTSQVRSRVDQHSQPSTPTPPGVYSHYPTPPYAQVAYQTTPNLPTQQQPLDMRNTLPPRLQASNNKPMDSQVPPRFQNSSSSMANSLSPRFQTSQVSAPGGINY